MMMKIMTLDMLLLIIMLLAALWTVMGRSLLKAMIGLAVTSAVITILTFRLNSPLAAVFELSVCTGLITVVFASTISLTKPLTHKEIVQMARARDKRYIYLPMIIILLAIVLWRIKVPIDFLSMGLDTTAPIAPLAVTSVRDILWNTRQIDLFGQIIIMIVGAFGVVTLFVESDKDE